ncbi:MAG TPA: Na+/H+ antiporter [Ktedonobacteraceae bacterium]|nr:Na+/H+ antiporter [Ktedonobacteraceae bacterium]
MTTTITLILGLLVATVVFASLATRLRIPYAILLVFGGALLGFIPGLPRVEMNPDIVLFLFLPPLVYASAWQTSWRSFRANLRPILLLAIGLVLVTTVVVAGTAHLLLGLPWPVAFVLGAVLATTDTVAANSIAKRMKLPQRIVAIVEGESLINDATGLVVYTFAVAAAVTGAFQATTAGWQFIFVSVGGLAIGLLIGWPIAWLHRHLEDAPIEITMTLLTPFAAYLLAELAQVSGVLATLAAGLYLSRQSSRFFSPSTRLAAYAVWDVLVFVLNGLLFLLLGLQLRQILTITAGHSLATLAGEALLVSLAVIIIRVVWVFVATYFPRWLAPRLRVRDPYPDWRNVTIVSWTGMRGGVSLAAALALPLVIASGQPFPQRDHLIALAFGVILVTLVGQGLSLIPLIAWISPKTDDEEERERQRVRLTAAQAALKRLQELAEQGKVPQEMLNNLHIHYQEQIRHANEHLDGTSPEHTETMAARQQLRRELIEAERTAVIGLRDRGQIDDETLHEIERELDLEEQRIREAAL